MSDDGCQTFIYKRFVETQTLAVQKIRGDTNLGIDTILGINNSSHQEPQCCNLDIFMDIFSGFDVY